MSPEDRRLVEAALAKGRVTRVPPGTSGLPSYGWNAVKNRLEVTSGEAPRWFAPGRGRFANPGIAARNERIRERIRAGDTYAEMMTAFGVSQNIIYQVAYRANLQVTPAPRTAAAPVVTPLVARIKPLADGTRTAAEIARTLGIHGSSVRRVCQSHNLPLLNGAAHSKREAEALTRRIIALADGSRTIAQIAAEAGCSIRSVHNRQRDRDLDIRPAPVGPKRGRL